MRLLQLATGPGELIDLHPHVTVVAGLDRTGRELLAEAVVGLASGRASGPRGLLEAHGVLFDLAPEALALLDIDSDGVQPVVTADDLPYPRPVPSAAPTPAVADPHRADLDARWEAARETDVIARSAVVAAADALSRAKAAVPEVTAPDETVVEALTVDRDATRDARQEATDRLPPLVEAAEAATAARTEVESATEEVHARREAAMEASAAIALRLDAARAERDPDAGLALEESTAALAAIESETEEARLAGLGEGPAVDDEPPAERIERIDREREALQKRLAAFGPADTSAVARRLEAVPATDGGILVPKAEAVALADELAAIEAELVATEAVGGTPGAGLAEGRARLDDARQSLLEAEQAVRRPELDRDLVDRLELAHAELLDAIEKSGGRLFGARAQRRVDALRAKESAVLEELDLPSYSDYMMGSSLLHVDPVKEAALDAARVELGAAEDAWKLLSTETETELARAELMERRRGLIDDARRLLERSVPSGAVIAELRAMRVEVEPPAELLSDLRQALDDVGVAVDDGALDREDLVLVAEAWLEEAGSATERERSLQEDLDRLADERDAAVAALDSRGGPDRRDGPAAEEDRAARLMAAREQRVGAEERHRAHLAVEREVATIAEELAVADALARAAEHDAAEADATVAAAAEAEADAVAARERLEAELADAEQAEHDAVRALQHALEQGSEVPDGPSPELLAAEAALADAEAEADAAARALAALEAERAMADEAAAPVAEVPPVDEVSAPRASEELEWYLLARLAAQRSVSLAGSLPLLLDDALGDLAPADIEHVLGRLERMAAAVQVIVVSDDPAAAAWAGLAGADRAAVVRPEPSSTV